MTSRRMRTDDERAKETHGFFISRVHSIQRVLTLESTNEKEEEEHAGDECAVE